MARIGVLTMSDGRDFVHRDVEEFITTATDRLAAQLREQGHEVMVGEHVSTNELAVSQARRIADARPDLTIYSGQHATWYAPRSDDPAENRRRVHLRPEVFYFPAGGASVQHLTAPGQATFARLSRRDGRYRMHVIPGGVRGLRRRDQRGSDAGVDLRVAARLRALGRRRW